MTPRFPLQQAPHPAAAQLLEQKLAALHKGLVPLVSPDGSEMLGWCAALRYGPSKLCDRSEPCFIKAFGL